MNRNEVLKKLQQFPDYKGLSQAQISKKLGNNVQSFRNKYHQLELKYSKFDYFEQLPQELQAGILSATVPTLKHSQVLNKSMSHNLHLSQNFYNQFCDLPWSVKEMRKYLNKTRPEKILFFHKSENRTQEFYLRNNNGNYKYIDINIENGQIYYINGAIAVRINELSIKLYDIDLFHMYHIYKLRQCETIKPGYSKAKVLEALDHFYNTRKGEDYKSLMFIFLYLHGNLKQFNQSVPKNEYKYYVISDDEDTTYGKDQLTINELKYRIDQQCQDMYEQLVSTITKL